jgi:hypothetical protein
VSKSTLQAKRNGTMSPDPVLKELTRIRNLLALDLLLRGMNSETVDRALQMGDANVRRLFPMREIRRHMKKPNEVADRD